MGNQKGRRALLCWYSPLAVATGADATVVVVTVVTAPPEVVVVVVVVVAIVQGERCVVMTGRGRAGTVPQSRRLQSRDDN